MRVSASSCTQSGAAAVSQKATFSQNQPNDLKLTALTVVSTKTPAMLEHGFKLCIFVGVACRYLLQDHRDPPQRNKLSPKSSQSELSFSKLSNFTFCISRSHVYTAYHDCFFYTRHLSVYSPVSLMSYMESCAAALTIIMFL